VGVFADTFAMLAEKADRCTRVEGAEMVRLIDSSPIPLGKLCEWAEWNGRIRGMKMHVVYHPGNDVPRCVDITPATVNDVENRLVVCVCAIPGRSHDLAEVNVHTT
jgi:putative transposase